MNQANVALIGCGMGVNNSTKTILFELIKESKIPIIIDADGINCLCSNIDILKAAKAKIILTPHPGELGRLLHKAPDEIQSDRLNTARSFASEYGVTLVLKGANSIVCGPCGDSFINNTGNPGMAKGGSGDLLSGIIAGFTAQGFSPADAARAAVYIHGLAGDAAAQNTSQRGMTPSDMLSYLPLLLSEFE